MSQVATVLTFPECDDGRAVVVPGPIRSARDLGGGDHYRTAEGVKCHGEARPGQSAVGRDADVLDV